MAGAIEDLKRMHIKIRFRGFPSGPGVKTSPSNAGGSGLIPHASWPKKKKKNIKQKHYYNIQFSRSGISDS